MSSAERPSEGVWDRVARWLGFGKTDSPPPPAPSAAPPGSAPSGPAGRPPDPELENLKAILAKTQDALKKAMEDRQAVASSVPSREPAARAAQAARPASGGFDEPKRGGTRSMNRISVPEDPLDTMDKSGSLEERLQRENADRLKLRKQLVSIQGSLTEYQEKLEEAENALFIERTRAADLEKERNLLKMKADELNRSLRQAVQEAHASDMGAVSAEVIELRDKVQELESGRATWMAERERYKQSVADETAARQKAEEEARALSRALEEARARLQAAGEKSAGAVEEAQAAGRRAEERAASLEKELAGLKASFQEEAAKAERLLEQERASRREAEETVKKLSSDLAGSKRLLDQQRETHAEALEQARAEWEKERREIQSGPGEAAQKLAQELESVKAALAAERTKRMRELEEARVRWEEEQQAAGKEVARLSENLSRELDTARAALRDETAERTREAEEFRLRRENDQRAWASRLAALQEQWDKDREEWNRRLQEAAAKPAAGAAPSQDMEKLLQEIDALTAENAGLQDEIRLLQARLSQKR
jgi:hypothetical protein